MASMSDAAVMSGSLIMIGTMAEYQDQMAAGVAFCGFVISCLYFAETRGWTD